MQHCIQLCIKIMLPTLPFMFSSCRQIRSPESVCLNHERDRWTQRCSQVWLYLQIKYLFFWLDLSGSINIMIKLLRIRFLVAAKTRMILFFVCVCMWFLPSTCFLVRLFTVNCPTETPPPQKNKSQKKYLWELSFNQNHLVMVWQKLLWSPNKTTDIWCKQNKSRNDSTLNCCSLFSLTMADTQYSETWLWDKNV